MNLVTQYRREYLLKHIAPANMAGLELGPYNQPTVTKSEGDIIFMDYLTRSEHIASEPNAPYQDDIPETDIVLKDNDYQSYTDKKFDYIIANHVIEHAPDMIGFLKNLCSMLKESGVLFLTLPDKKFSFDRYRPNTTLPHILNDHFAGPEVSLRQHLIEDLLTYDRRFVGQAQDELSRYNADSIRKVYEQTPHYGLHCHVFQSETIVNTLLVPLFFMNFVPFDVIDFRHAEGRFGGEMIVVLRKGPCLSNLDVSQIFSDENSMAFLDDVKTKDFLPAIST